MKTLAIFFHGTSQDNTSKLENTVKLMQMAKSHGYAVEELGGPGSGERIIKTQIQDQGPSIFTMGESLDDIGSFGLEFAMMNATGVGLGGGVERNIQEAIRIVGAYRKQGYKRIFFVGFSRGAYTIAELLPLLAATKMLDGIDARAVLLDPVPGPFRRKLHTIPREVSSVKLIYAQHEGRPGFERAEFITDRMTRLDAQTMIGVHGDVGGSTQSVMTKLALEEVSRFVLGRGLLSTDEHVNAILEAVSQHRKFTFTPFAHALAPRKSRSTAGVGYVETDNFVIPYPGAFDVLWTQSPLFRATTTFGPATKVVVRNKTDESVMKQILELRNRDQDLVRQRRQAEQEKLARHRELVFQQWQTMKAVQAMQAQRRALYLLEQQLARLEEERHEPIQIVQPQRLVRLPNNGRVVDNPALRRFMNQNVVAQALQVAKRSIQGVKFLL